MESIKALPIISLFVSTSMGAIWGLVIALIINCILLEISISAFFNIYFGLFYIVVSYIIWVRIANKAKISTDTSLSKTQPKILTHDDRILYLNLKL